MPEEPFALTLHTSQPMAGDYDAIHSAVMETARGRWFLQEYARRNRNADTAALLATIERIEAILHSESAIPAQSHPPHLPLARNHARTETVLPHPLSAHQLHELRAAIILARESLPAIGPDGRISLKGTDFSHIATGIEFVSARMRAAAEHVQETAWSLREHAEKETGPEQDALHRRCGELETQARELSTSSAQLDELAASATMVAGLLAEIAMRLDGVVGASRPAQPEAPTEMVAPAPARPQPETSQNETPAAAANIMPLPPEPEPEPVIAAQASAPQPHASETMSPPRATAAPATNANWLDMLAPPIRARNASNPAPASAFNFDFDDAPQAPIAMPNPAMREMSALFDPVSPQAQAEIAAPVIEPEIAQTETAEVDAFIEPPTATPMIEIAPKTTAEPVHESDAASDIATSRQPNEKTSGDDADLPPDPPQNSAPQSAQTPAVNGGHAPKPAFRPIQIVKPADPLAPIIALSDEEKIALFS
jgi:hypothetical protein